MPVLPEKLALSTPAFLPPSADFARGGPAAQVLVPGAPFPCLALLSSFHAPHAGGVGGRLQRNPRSLRRHKCVTGGVYVGLGVVSALAGPSRK